MKFQFSKLNIMHMHIKRHIQITDTYYNSNLNLNSNQSDLSIQSNNITGNRQKNTLWLLLFADILEFKAKISFNFLWKKVLTE